MIYRSRDHLANAEGSEANSKRDDSWLAVNLEMTEETWSRGASASSWEEEEHGRQSEYDDYMMCPWDFRFSKGTISSTFRSGADVVDTTYRMQSGDLSVHAMPTIRIFLWNGVWYTADNRRLWCFQQAGFAFVPVNRTHATGSQQNKLDTQNGGVSVCIRPPRRQYAGKEGHVEARYGSFEHKPRGQGVMMRTRKRSYPRRIRERRSRHQDQVPRRGLETSNEMSVSFWQESTKGRRPMEGIPINPSMVRNAEGTEHGGAPRRSKTSDNLRRTQTTVVSGTSWRRGVSGRACYARYATAQGTNLGQWTT